MYHSFNRNRVEKIFKQQHLCVQIEHSMPFIPAFLRAIGIIRDRIEYDEKRQRYMLTLPASATSSTGGTSKREALNMMQSMETKLNNMAAVHNDLSRKVDSLMQVGIRFIPNKASRSMPPVSLHLLE